MRKMLMAILALAGASSLMVPVRVYADIDGIVQEMVPEARDITRAARLRTAIDPTDPDTVWIGHIYDPTFTAGGTMPAGGYGPYKVGRGPNNPMRAGSPVTIGANGAWDFDRFQSSENDSLQGWWPLERAYQTLGATNYADHWRAWSGLDHGNQANYVINQGAPKRTFGVVGVWHRDPGDNLSAFTLVDSIAGTNVQVPKWLPTEVGGAGSTASAWMGIRSHGDLSVRDEVANGGTGNPFNAVLLENQGNNGGNQVGSVSATGTDHNFPGYGSQMDQMLYRDVQLLETDGLNIAFNYSTNMSTLKITATASQIGWFDKDPLSPAANGAYGTVTSDGNFISATAAGANAPCDSFMVYIGAPVNDAACDYTDGLSGVVYDAKRRWFSEVIQITGPGGIIGKNLLSVAGVNAPTPVSVDVGSLYPTELQAIKDADGAGGGGKVRIVFRVKTNRGFDDENRGGSNAYDSGTRGAAILDNVVVNGWAAAEGNFEAASSINNDTAVDPLNAWKSTGKPPAVYWHVHSIQGAGLPYNDPCGGLDNPNRSCNLYGKVATAGDHDAAEKMGGVFGSNTTERAKWLRSPTVNLSSTGNGPGFYNAMGIDDEIARTTGDYVSFFSLYNGGLVNATSASGEFMAVGYQSYPARQTNGNICWGETRRTPFISFYGTRACFNTFFTGSKANSLIRTTNAANRPDSLRVVLEQLTACFRFLALNALTCAPTGANSGIYMDGISLALIDSPPPPGIQISIWDLINDAFPINTNSALIPAGFDTTAAQVRTGLNTSPSIGLLRAAVSGDSVLITASGASHRLDMVFRVLPGPGNYMTTGSKASGVARVPQGTKVLATAGDGSFWGALLGATAGDNGEFASGPHGSSWNQHVWNSARLDTVERNLFPTANNGGDVGLTPGRYAGMVHELDPNFQDLGIVKWRCAMTDPTLAANSTNILCDGSNYAAYPPVISGFPAAGAEFIGSLSGQTKEYTKVIPDGLLTPGSHVQYFFRKSDVATPTVYELGPDTNFVFQGSEGSSDGHRWQQFGVLPDRWKDAAWAPSDANAAAPACMLFIDWQDRRGDERFFVGVADSIGATLPARYGAHNGWHARGDQDITASLQTVIGTADDWGVYAHGGQPGTIWDMYGVKASESATTSSSMGPPAAGTGFLTGKDDRRGPTGDMLRNYYRILLALTGDLNAGNIGPYADKSSNDVGLLQDFASGIAGTSQPRAVWFQGRGFIEGQINGGALAHPLWPPSYFGAGLASGDYRSYAGNADDIVDLIPNAPTVTNGTIYGVSSNCFIQNDVLTLSGPLAPPQSMAAKYEDFGANNPNIASIYAPSSLPATTHPMVTLVDGWRIQSMGSQNTLQSMGTIDYYYRVITNLFGSLACALAPGGPISVGENPNQALVNFLALRSENPFRGGAAKITFGITRKEKVELKVYDVTGRLVKTLANREFDAGNDHTIFWDGSNDDGQLVSRGVYFYQLRTPSFVSQKKLAVLKN